MRGSESARWISTAASGGSEESACRNQSTSPLARPAPAFICEARPRGAAMQTSAGAVVRVAYAAGGQTPQTALGGAVNYEPKYLRAIPPEVIERDYGCGDPSEHVRRGETVLDLCCGTRKICFIASQIVGPEG